jgi:hypothetical protein
MLYGKEKKIRKNNRKTNRTKNWGNITGRIIANNSKIMSIINI